MAKRTQKRDDEVGDVGEKPRHLPVVPKGRIPKLTHEWQGRFNLLKGQALGVIRGLRNRRRASAAVSDGTRSAREDCVLRYLRWLCLRGYRVKHVSDLRPKSLFEYFAYLQQQDYSDNSRKNMYTHLRHFFEHGLRKFNCIEDRRAYFGDRPMTRSNAVRSKAVSDQRDEDGNPIDPQALIERIAKESIRAAVMLSLCWEGGLRIRESAALQPHIAEVEPGVFRVRATGSKGGRERLVDLRAFPKKAEKMREAMFAARELVRRQDGTLFRGKSMEAVLQHVYYICRKVGMTRKDMGVVTHSFRHQHILDCYSEAGFTPPVHGVMALAELDERQLALRALEQRALIMNLGHYDERKTGAYCGSAAKQRDLSGVPKAATSRANYRVSDIGKGDAAGLAQRRHEIATLAVSEIDAIVAANLERGYQLMRDAPPPHVSRSSLPFSSHTGVH